MLVILLWSGFKGIKCGSLGKIFVDEDFFVLCRNTYYHIGMFRIKVMSAITPSRSLCLSKA